MPFCTLLLHSIISIPSSGISLISRHLISVFLLRLSFLCSCQSSIRSYPLLLIYVNLLQGNDRIYKARLRTFDPTYEPTLNRLVGSNGLGPSTSRLSGGCSNQLSYEPILVEISGVEPLTPCLQGRCSTN